MKMDIHARAIKNLGSPISCILRAIKPPITYKNPPNTKQYNIIKPILIASGGCTAFNVSSACPNISLTLIEPNKLQIKLDIKLYIKFDI